LARDKSCSVCTFALAPTAHKTFRGAKAKEQTQTTHQTAPKNQINTPVLLILLLQNLLYRQSLIMRQNNGIY